MPISEKELRAHVREMLVARATTEGARMFEELQIEHGAARVDLALVGAELQAFELKSDFDNFSRMHNQIHAYNRVFDRITIVTGAVHAQAALSVVPSWWGVTCVSRTSSGSLSSQTLREAAHHNRQEPLSLAMLLWREEAAGALLAQAGKKVAKRATRPQLQSQLASALSLEVLRGIVSQALLTRNSEIKALTRSAPRDGSSRPVASCLDFHFPL